MIMKIIIVFKQNENNDLLNDNQMIFKWQQNNNKYDIKTSKWDRNEMICYVEWAKAVKKT